MKGTTGKRPLTTLFICSLIFALIFQLIAGTTAVSAADTSKVNYIEEMRTYTSQGYVRVGHFEIDGRTAFCMEHSNESPATGTETAASALKNDTVRKILYYGWEGPGQWSGFADMKQGITLTSLLLSESYTTAQPFGTYNFVPGLIEFRNYVNSQPAPASNLRFDKTGVKAYYDPAIGGERTEDINVVGAGAGTLTINVPEGYLLHDNATGEERSGEFKSGVGFSFYLRPVGRYSDEKESVITAKGTTLQPIIFATSDTSIQDLTRLDVAEDVTEDLQLNVRWLWKKDLRIIKTDADTGERLTGAKFRLIEIDDNGNPVADSEYEVDANGELNVSEVLKCGKKYSVTEIQAPHAYCLSDEVQTLEITGEKDVEELTFSNRKQLVTIKLDKKGRRFTLKDGNLEERLSGLKDAQFKIIAAEDILDWGGHKVKYKNGETVAVLITDENGCAEAGNLPPGRYSIFESKAPSGFMLDPEVKTYSLVPDADKLELKYTVSNVNEPEETELIITKYDAETGDTLQGAIFEINDVEGNSLRIQSGEDGRAVAKNLPKGSYTFKEVKAPEGYDVDGRTQHFTVGTPETKLRGFLAAADENAEDNIVSLECRDHKTSIPDTGDENRAFLLMYSALGIMSIIGLVIYGFIAARRKLR